ncbi:MAG: rhodanese-like domain-containing protein [Bacteroidales bacterium]|nr:rhodanese-like domain-containing protein [Bacteroidales bacterium]
MNTRIIISIVFVGLGLIIAAVPQNVTLPYKLTAEEMLVESNNRVQFYSPEEIAEIIIQKNPEFQLIDVRSQDEYEKFSLPNSINIPLTDILADEYRDLLHQDIKRNIFFSNGTVNAMKAWMITRQLGWENNYVMEGGLNYWAEVIMNPIPPASTSPNEEIAKYEFRKAAGEAIHGNTSIKIKASTTIEIARPPIKRKNTKQRVQGGC